MAAVETIDQLAKISTIKCTGSKDMPPMHQHLP
jgi:hypothetical protein